MSILTDKTPLATPVGADVIHVVDVSDTSSDPAGTSKKVTADNLSKALNPGNIPNTPAGDIAATDVQAALNELDTEKSPVAGSSSIVTVGTLSSGDADAVVSNANLTTPGKVELSTPAETTTGTDATRAVTPDGLAGSDYGKRIVTLVLLDDTTDNAVADGQGGITWTWPIELNGWNLANAHASVEVAGVTGTQNIQIHNVTQAVDMLTTPITIDSTELTSYTAATPPVIDTGNDNGTTGDKLRIDTNAIHSGTTAKGLQVILTFQLP